MGVGAYYLPGWDFIFQGRFFILQHYQWQIQGVLSLQTKFSLISQGFFRKLKKNMGSRRQVC